MPEPKVLQEELDLAGSGTLQDGVKFASHRVLKAPPDFSVGLLVLKRNSPEKRKQEGKSPHNHLVIQRTNHRVEDIAERIKQEHKPLQEGSKIVRRGKASGVPLPEFPEPKQLSKCTLGMRVPLECAKPTTTAYRMAYHNDKTRKWHEQYVYNEMRGRKLLPQDSSQPTSQNIVHSLWNSEGYRRIALAEMASRFRYFALLEKYELAANRSTLDDFLDNYAFDKEEYSNWHKEFPEDIPTEWEYLLLKHCFSLYETINHQACAAHNDGAGDETLALYGRPSADESLDDFGLLEQSDDGSNDGHLGLLNDGIAIRLIANHMELHATMDDTLHVADLSRNTRNFTTTKHPRKKPRLY